MASNDLVNRTYLSTSAINNSVEDMDESGRDIVRLIQQNPFLRTFSFDGVRLNASDRNVRRMIVDAVLRHRHVKKIRFDRVTVRLDLDQWRANLRNMESLEILSFRSAVIAGPDYFYQLLRDLRGLKELSIACSPFGDIVAQSLARFLRFRSSLRSVTFFKCSLSESGLACLAEVLLSYSTVTELFISDGCVALEQANAELWARALETNETLRKLSLMTQDMPPESSRRILAALAANNGLEQADLGKVQLCREGSLALARVIENNQALERLSLVGTLPDRIQEDVDHTFADKVDVTPVFRALTSNDTLKKFSMSSFSLCAPGLEDAIESGLLNYSLQELGLSRCHFAHEEERVSLMNLVSSRFVGLEELDLSKTCLGVDATVALCRGLQESVQVLHLNGCEIGNSGVTVVSEMLTRNHTMRFLGLASNEVSDEGLMSLARALYFNTTLTYLELPFISDHISENAKRVLLDGIKANTTLTAPRRRHLWLDPLTEPQTKELNFYLHRNKLLQPLLRQNLSLPLALWPRALEWANKFSADMVYFLLKERCDMLCAQRSRRAGRKRKRGM